MKKVAALLFLITSFAQAQYSVKGTLTNNLETDWVILYRIEGSIQKFVQNTTIKKDTVSIDGEKQVIGTFQFQLPANTKVGSYRINYRTSGASFVDFIFNKENVSFAFHPDYPEQTTLFSESEENIIYKEYLNDIFKQQQKLDSLQISAIRNPEVDLKTNYKNTLAKINTIHQKYLESTKEMYVQPFIKASLRANPSEIKTIAKDYMSNMTSSFFNNMDFSNKTLINSAFLVDRITDFVFYINYSDDVETQQKLYKTSIETAVSKIKNPNFKKNVIEFLIGQFEETKNLGMIDFLFENYYNKLPESLQSDAFKTEKLTLLATEIGRIAPDFSWKENGKNVQLSTLNNAKNYVLVFWSTSCSHCLREIPELHTFLQDKSNVKVVAFSLERNDADWNKMKVTLPNWHHVLGLNKWENKTARTYNINATPTYFVLDANKKIIAKPETLNDLKMSINQL
ncbi:TlpA family protein disulfide reductase [Polaribacter sp. IC073]|uniref:TlpA family protein disulfide reductase n=1 Tax=Polaribacter sp. IC073 TaxID=2508540 RepID=UPI0011BEF632|nr:TlpA disulfide reductase family protein [Polaribacter sp. IC073]TXD50088.1 TlpA family protein disulfide reductase [Polaribacter sp. IC073]